MAVQKLLYRRNTSNIHEIVLHAVRMATLSEFANRLKVIMAETSDSEVMRLSIYVSAIPSIQYMLSIMREIKAARLRPIRSRIAVIYSPILANLSSQYGCPGHCSHQCTQAVPYKR